MKTEEGKKKPIIRKHHPDLSEAWRCCPDVFFLQLGLITAPDVSNPSASGVIQVSPKHQEPAKLPKPLS